MDHKVFIVDDDPIMGNLLQSQISEIGYDAEYFNGPEPCIERIYETRTGPENSRRIVIIADANMPEGGGNELRTRLRENPETSGIPFVFLAAGDETTLPPGIIQTCADSLCYKPFKMEELLEHIRKVKTFAEKAEKFRNRNNFRGTLSRTPISHLVQIAELNHKTGSLSVKDTREQEIGTILWEGGRIRGARTREIEGEEAFYELMETEEGQFVFSSDPAQVSGGLIDKENSLLIAQAEKLAELSRDARNILPDPDTRFRRTSRKISDVLEQEIGKEPSDTILSLIEKGMPVRDITCPEMMSIPRARAVLSALIREGVVAVSEDREQELPSRDISDNQPGDRIDPSDPESDKDVLPDSDAFLRFREIRDKELTGIMRITAPHTGGSVYFKEGQAIHAYHGKTVGKKAFFRILDTLSRERAHPADISFRPEPVMVPRTLDESLAMLIREARSQSSVMDRVSPGTYDMQVSLNYEAIGAGSENQERPGLVYMCSLIDQYGTPAQDASPRISIREIIEESQMTDLQTYKHLLYMIQKNLLFVHSEKKRGFRIVTDSGTDIPEDVIRELNITVVPLCISLGRQQFQDRGDSESGPSLSPREFYQAIASDSGNQGAGVRISPPDETVFCNLFRDIASSQDILGIFSSGHLSKAFYLAKAVKEKHFDLSGQNQSISPGQRVRIDLIDSGLIASGAGILVSEAGAVARSYPHLTDKFYSFLNLMIPKIRVIFAARSFRFLARGGYVGRSEAVLGNLVRSRPILSLRNGDLVRIDAVRGSKKAGELMVQLIEQNLPAPDFPIRAGVSHGDALDDALFVRDLLESRLNCRDIMMTELGPATGIRCGPGTVAVAYFPVET